MRAIVSGFIASALALICAASASAQTKPLKLGAILDMSGLYADITGPGSEMAAKMAAEDFGGEVLGRKIEIIAADHLNKADLSANIARDMLDNQGVEAIKAVKAAGTTEAAAVMKIMKETPIDDFFARNGRIREDGRMVHEMYLFEVKKPSESKGRWDVYKLLTTVSGADAFQPIEQSRCPLVKK